jgi:hypothetical protein
VIYFCGEGRAVSISSSSKKEKWINEVETEGSFVLPDLD